MNEKKLRELYKLQNDVIQTALEVLESFKSRLNPRTYREMMNGLRKIREENEKSFHEDLQRIRCYKAVIYS